MLARFLDPLVMRVLTEEANKIAETARQGAKTRKIRNAISVGVAQTDGSGKYRIDIIVDTNKESGAPEAAAYEYGSGIHRKDNPSTYVIKPGEGKSMLAFPWPDHDPDFPTGKKYIGYSNRGNFLFNYVDHPGVAAQPYLRPAIAKNRPSVKARILSVFKRGLLDSIKVEFKDVR